MNKTLIALAAGLVLLGACSNDETDFKKTAEKTIVSEWKKQVDEDLTVVCASPSSTAVGTTFDCEGTSPDNTVYTFQAEITKKDEVTITQTG